jgi:hypothetical protein
LWQHDGRRPVINSIDDYRKFQNAGVSIYHSSKDGSVIRALNSELGLLPDGVFDIDPMYVLVKNPKSTSKKIPGNPLWIRLGTSTWWCAMKLVGIKDQANFLAMHLSWNEISKEDYEKYFKRTANA